MRRFAMAAALGLLIGMSPSARCQDLVPSVRDLIENLSPEAGQSRGIRLPANPDAGGGVSASPGPTPATANGRPRPPASITATTAPPGVAAVSLSMVTFATGSAAITPAAERTLEHLGAALASGKLAPYRFRIEGHTDTVGSGPLNQRLSERRAMAVREYLERHHGIAASRLEAVGLGEQQLLVFTPDETPELQNRRVQILNLGG